jgi:hypothetical protein
MSEDKLASFLNEGQEWERMKTNIPGVFILKLPSYRGNPARLAVELNPVDSTGSPTKKRGLILRTASELEDFRKIISSEKLESLMERIEKLNPPSEKKTKERVLEI